MRKRFLSIVLLLSLSLSPVVASASANKTITCTTYTTETCNGTVTTTTSHVVCSIGGEGQSLIKWTCKKCGATGSFGACAHFHPTSNPTEHTAKIYTNNTYGYSGTSQTFTVYPLTIAASDGIKYSVSVTGATATDYVRGNASITISVSNVPSGYSVKAESEVGTYIFAGSYSFSMPRSSCTVQLSATTEYGTYVGQIIRGPGKTQFYYYGLDYFDITGNTYPYSGGVYYESGGFVSKSISGSLETGSTTYDCSSWNESTDATPIYANTHSSGDNWYGTFIDRYTSNDGVYTYTYTPSSQDIANGVKVGYLSKFGKLSSFTKPTSSVTFSCKWFVIYIPRDMRTIVDPTSSFSSTSVTKKYGDLAFSAGFTTDSDGTLSYSSSNTSVATISSSGSITITGVGSTTITASTAETSSYYADSKTMTLTVSKGTISVSTNPSASSIQYGQTLASSIITGGSTKNQAGNSVTGAWSWKSPATVPNAGTTSFTVIFTPSDTTNYNY